MFSSKTDLWSTPNDLFEKYNDIFNFNTDVCAISDNAKCQHFFSPEQNGLIQDWRGSCWMNPPYGRTIGKWIEKASTEQRNNGTTVVCLLPARTDTRWFHEFIYNKPNVTIELLRGRIKFGGHKNCAPFPSMIVIFQTTNR